ncbi:MAG: type II toxin-antitoxin system Phd/YefM family antitoxin [Sulfuricaulis sp.]|uniref:type II toxin-antitoxin system Phd/YefM family antitoxin n=1 Tax=Sulfuricaulis sp. TaxID=2003553 RepID=UPI0025F09081|nr:type II toxin-antitoxin system Phd/YefM family antitoxin [Sulfuricaulis sp.]MCR4347039.1 type II toxin-antitoxin system Phd/YefM family antitoxin [Sulfuricaulis sp.]
MKKRWQLQEAKNQLSRVVTEAREHGPQTITVHGHPAAVVISIEEFRRLAAEKKPLSQFFRDLAPKGAGLRVKRSRDTGRRTEL